MNREKVHYSYKFDILHIKESQEEMAKNKPTSTSVIKTVDKNSTSSLPLMYKYMGTCSFLAQTGQLMKI